MTVLAQKGKIWVPKLDTPPIAKKGLNTPTRIVFGVLSLLLYAFVVLEIWGVIPGIAIRTSYKIEAHKATVTSTELTILAFVIIIASIIIASLFVTIACNEIEAGSIAMLATSVILISGTFYASVNLIPSVKTSHSALDELYYQEAGEHKDVLRETSFNSDNKTTMTAKDGSIYLISRDNKNSTTVYSIKELETKK